MKVTIQWGELGPTQVFEDIDGVAHTKDIGNTNFADGTKRVLFANPELFRSMVVEIEVPPSRLTDMQVEQALSVVCEAMSTAWGKARNP